jgi:hypothetical protein
MLHKRRWPLPAGVEAALWPSYAPEPNGLSLRRERGAIFVANAVDAEDFHRQLRLGDQTYVRADPWALWLGKDIVL